MRKSFFAIKVSVFQERIAAIKATKVPVFQERIAENKVTKVHILNFFTVLLLMVDNPSKVNKPPI